MSDLQRGRRLPVFVDEEQWSRAYRAAMEQVEHLYATGIIEIPHGKPNGTLRDIAVAVATAALRAAAQDDEGDVGELPGVHVDEIRNSTATDPSDEDGVRYRGDIRL